MNKHRVLWCVSPWQGIAEAFALGVFLLFLLSRIIGDVAGPVYSNGILFLCGVTGFWAVFRIRLPNGRYYRQILWEIGVGLLLGLVMAVGLMLVGRVTGWESVWLRSTRPGMAESVILFFAIGLGYVPARVGVRLWLWWGEIRRRKFRYELTNTLLMTVIFVAVAIIMLPFFMTLFRSNQPFLEPAENLFTALSMRWLHTLFPALSILVLLMLVLVVVLIPPALIFSYFAARRTTKRLERLTAVTNALQAGEYEVRVPVEGEDEVAQLQTNFNQMADELARTLADLKTERDRVASLLKTQRDLVANVSHELRTPVATTRAMLESSLNYWQGEEPPAELRSDLQVMDGEIKRLQRLIDDLFTLSRLEVGGLSLDCTPLNTAPTLRRLVTAMASYAWETGKVELMADVPDELPLICIDEARLEQILTNLLRNGLFHTPPGGIVAVHVEIQSDSLLIHVRDTGDGIPADELPHIWERFYQGENGRSHAGSGLGLAVVKDLTEAMNGTVHAESTLGQGSSFTLTFPYS